MTVNRTAEANWDKHDGILRRVMNGVLEDVMQLFKPYADSEGLHRWMAATVLGLTHAQPQSKNWMTVLD